MTSDTQSVKKDLRAPDGARVCVVRQMRDHVRNDSRLTRDPLLLKCDERDVRDNKIYENPHKSVSDRKAMSSRLDQKGWKERRKNAALVRRGVFVLIYTFIRRILQAVPAKYRLNETRIRLRPQERFCRRSGARIGAVCGFILRD